MLHRASLLLTPPSGAFLPFLDVGVDFRVRPRDAGKTEPRVHTYQHADTEAVGVREQSGVARCDDVATTCNLLSGMLLLGGLKNLLNQSFLVKSNL